MLKLILPALMLLCALPTQAQEAVQFRSRDGAMLNAVQYQPAGGGKRPAVVLLHGCGGLARKDGTLFPRHSDWAERFAAAGFVVLLPDTYGSRGLPAQCRERDREINPAGRAADAFGALAYLAKREDIDARRILVMGWSNGGSTVLRVAGKEPGRTRFARAIAFYPGCRPLLKRPWTARIPLDVFHGLADNWTPITPCVDLSNSGGAFTLHSYPGAHHDFDAPNLPMRSRDGVAFSGSGDGRVTTGTHEPSRQDAIAKVMAIARGM